MTDALLANLKGLKEVQILYSPADASAEIQVWLQPGWTAGPQTDGDLGERLVAAFENAFKDGCARVLIIGSDCPYVQDRRHPARLGNAGEQRSCPGSYF